MVRLGYRPSLDGVRALAIVPVVCLHAFGYPKEGALGVDVFFVLSGFLITTLLLEEQALTGRISLRAFYRRRAARLFPALLLMTLVFAIATRFTDPRAIAYALTYTSNIAQLFHGGVPYAFGHLWSLAEEEQFYVLWPPVLGLLLAHRSSWVPKAIGIAIGAAIIDRIALVAAGAAPQRLYIGPDTHADPLLVGCAFAVWYTRRGPLRRQSIAVVGLLGVSGGIATLDHVSANLVALQLRTAYAVLCGLMVLGAASGGIVPRLLEWRPLVFLGRISYSLYLWHVPIQVATHTTFHSRPGRAALGLPLVFAAAVVSYYVVERPLRVLLAKPRTKTKRQAIAHAVADPAA